MNIDDERTYTIRELAKEFGISFRTLRFYEQIGTLTPARMTELKGSRRIYSEQNRRRLKLILEAKALGFSIMDIKQFISTQEGENLVLTEQQCNEQMRVLHERRDDIAASLKLLYRMIRDIHGPAD